MDNVFTFPGSTPATQEEVAVIIDPTFVRVEKIISDIQPEEFDDLIILGNKKNGNFYFATATGDPAEILWDLERAKAILMDSMFDYTE